MRKSFGVLAVSLLLAACGSNPQSYITGKKDPIVNIEAQINDLIKVETNEETFSVANVSQSNVNVAYKLFWYDKNGVTQPYFNGQESLPWENLWLVPQEKREVALQKPTDESVNYRLYLRGQR